MKKFLAGLISFVLVFNASVMAAIVGTPQLNRSGANNTVCDVNGSTDYYPIGDTRGFSILTKREVVRDCNVTINEQGQCIRWEEQVIDQSMTPGKYNAYESNNYQDSIGSLLAALGAYDQIEHLWSGWKGYCEIGTKSDFSWASDPMFWASMAMSMLMSGTTPGGAGTPTSGFLDSTSVGTSFNNAANTMGQGLSDAMSSVGIDSFNQAAEQAGMDAFQNITAEAAGNRTLNQITNQAITQVYNNLGRCLVSASWGVATSLYEFGQEDGSGYDCDPVDEVCGTGADAQVSESDVMTMDETQFNDLITQFANNTPPDNLYDYVYVIGTESGIVTFRMKKMNEMNSTAMDQAAVKDLQEKMKAAKLMLSLGMTTLAMAGCLGGMGAGISMPGLTSDDRASIRTIGAGAIDFAGRFIPQPYGPLIGAALKLALYLATSFKSIDSCHDESDAKEQGVRHTRTQKAIKFDLCHLKDVICAEEAFLFGGCALDGYEFCCYDQIMTKILVEQLKAQLGRDWAHCTGITLRDLNYISFKQCSDAQITDSTTVDGAHQVGIYDTTKAFQYKYKCIDMTEFLEYLQATIGTEISMDDFESFWNDMTQQSPYGATIP